jgi:hypothetical protein
MSSDRSGRSDSRVWFFLQCFGLSGGYLVGDDVLISELRYTNRG